MNVCQAHWRLVQAGVAFAAVVMVAGCGNNYRPAVVPISASGPPAQVSSYAILVSSTSKYQIESSRGVPCVLNP